MLFVHMATSIIILVISLASMLAKYSLRQQDTDLRVNITIVYEHIVCATSAFRMCMLRVVFNVILF